MGDFYDYDVLVIGGGHAGTEAALAAARMGAKTALLTTNLDTIGQMSCNPAIGGVAKGQIVREIDALGGAMGRAIDATGIQFRVLNRSKGPAMHGPRAQADKRAYQIEIKRLCEEQPNLALRQETVDDLVTEGQRAALGIRGVRVADGTLYRAGAVVLCAGTFMRGLIHVGDSQSSGGRMGESATHGISGALARLGFHLQRFKTGTPMRLNGRTIDVQQTQLQLGDPQPQPFSYLNDRIDCEQLPCWITFTTPEVHQLIRANLHRAPMYSGQIRSTGPAVLPFDRNQNRPLRRERPASVVPGARGAADQRGLCQRPFHQPAARSPGHDGPHDPRPGPRGNRPLRLCDRIRLRPARSVETLAGDEAGRRAVLRRAGQRHDRL